MSSHQSSKDKPRAAKCNHFCHPFDTHNFRLTCREAGKGDDPCVTLVSSCPICSSFTEEQITKISHRKRYSKNLTRKIKQKTLAPNYWVIILLNRLEARRQSWKLLRIASSHPRLVLNLCHSWLCPFELLLALSRLHQVRLYN